MSHKVSANFTMPTILNTLKPAASAGTAKTVTPKASTSGTSSSSTSGSGLDTTFLNLLSTELQNQDPTAPVDSTAMVGQMISLNQLDQLISINQTLTSSASTGTTPVAVTAPAAPANGSSASGALSPLSPAASAAAAQSQLPFDPNTLMPVNQATGNTSALATSINSLLNTATTGVSGFANTISGGK
jgi:flagellar basal-body rod modification protein FlgD